MPLESVCDLRFEEPQQNAKGAVWWQAWSILGRQTLGVGERPA
jgi:hypothetical protein